MILTCPQCASRYFVDQARIGPNGRTVKCASCGARWTAHAEEQPLELTPAAKPAEPEPAAAAEPPAPPAHEALPKVFRDRAATQKKVREAATAGVIWAGLAGGFVLLLAATAIFRQNIATLWPRTAGAYAMVGLPVNLVGLTIESQRAQPQLQDGHAALAVSGALRNVRGRPVTAPPLRITLLNASGKAVAVKIADPGGATIPPGEARRFVVTILDPPVSATDVDIAFVLDPLPRKPGPQPKAAAVSSAGDSTTLSLRGGSSPGPVVQPPPAQEAQPLPSSSPYALPAAAADNSRG